MKRIYSLSYFVHPASGYESPQAGTSRGIFFSNFLPTMLRAALAVWKGWEIRIHHDAAVVTRPHWPLVSALADAGRITLVPMGSAKGYCSSMLWRILPCVSDGDAIVVCRDIDSLPMERDRLMVEQAFDLGAEAHAVLDSESHSGPLMGGMTAYRHDFAPYPLDDPEIDFNRHGADQKWLNKHVWPVVRAKTVVHQRRRDIMYNAAMKTFPVAPQLTPLDKVVRHIGAGYDREIAAAVLREFYPDKEFDALENVAKWAAK